MLPIMDPESELYMCAGCGSIFDADDFEKFQDKTYKLFFTCGRRIKPLNLSEREMAMIKAIAIVNPGEDCKLILPVARSCLSQALNRFSTFQCL